MDVVWVAVPTRKAPVHLPASAPWMDPRTPSGPVTWAAAAPSGSFWATNLDWLGQVVFLTNVKESVTVSTPSWFLRQARRDMHHLHGTGWWRACVVHPGMRGTQATHLCHSKVASVGDRKFRMPWPKEASR